ncbi:hypothetical protein FJT64_023611 [Amphibalanus amphitrite]|uniref:Uncharacterized protein n=1 Tax=Amphibalanus amphitrite TaxID=1232801 RepID=A0A6A4WLN1_AMPAM|nr:hypothetical protein FJT64_023611 [Amphibalanus amphitrite]
MHCDRPRAFNSLNSGKAVREPYIITRRYNDSRVRRARADGVAGAGTREASDEASLDRANLLYLADGDPLPSSWRAPVANSKRDVDVEIEVEETENSTSTTPQDKTTTTTTTSTTESPPVTIKVKIEKEKDEDVFNDNPNTKSTKSPTSIEASASITAERRMPSPRRSSSVVLDSEVFSETPARTRVLSLSPARPSSVLRVASGDGRPSVEETITSGGGSDSWGISGSSDRLMALISSIEKALRVPLGGSDGDVDQFTVVDDSSDAVQTTRVISSQPDITEQKTNYIYSVNDPQPPLVVATATQEKKPDMVKMDITTGTGQPDERDGPRKPPIPSPRPPASEERARSGLRAAIVDRLLQDLRKMASARGSEMARAESDLIEILHDYQTDLMDEDEKTIAGMPFQGVRIHDNVAIPVVYQAVPIKLEGLSQHRLVVRSSDPGSARDLHNSWDDAPYNPP